MNGQQSSVVVTYLEIIDTRSGDARHTGIGAMFESLQATLEAFRNARQLENEAGGFLLDLYINNDLEDTIKLDERGVELVSGIVPLSPEYYVEFDEKYWLAVKKAVKA